MGDRPLRDPEEIVAELPDGVDTFTLRAPWVEHSIDWPMNSKVRAANCCLLFETFRANLHCSTFMVYVLDGSQTESCSVVTDLVANGIKVGSLSYTGSRDAISNTVTYVQEIYAVSQLSLLLRHFGKLAGTTVIGLKAILLQSHLAEHTSASLLHRRPIWHSAGVLPTSWLQNSSSHLVHSTPRIGARHQPLVTSRKGDKAWEVQAVFWGTVVGG